MKIPKPCLSLWIAWFTLLPLMLHANESAVDSTITAVTVYPDRAIVTRSATPSLTEGEHDIAFGGLPSNIDEASIRANASGSGIKILSVQIKRDFIESAEPARVNALNSQIHELEQQNQDLSDEKSDLAQKRKLLETLSSQLTRPDKDHVTTISVAEIKSLVIYYGDERREISQRLRSIERTTADNNKTIRKLRGELSTLQGQRGPKTRKVIVTVKASRSVHPTLQIDYLVHGASWTAQYDVHAKATDHAIEFISYGIVRQQTGEDWSDVSLTLSTARPQQGTSVPDLSPWVLDFPRPITSYAPRSSLDEVKRDRSMMATDQELASASESAAKGKTFLTNAKKEADKADYATSTVGQKGFSAVFNVPGKVDVPSDRETHRCTISIRKMKSERFHLSIPKLIPGAYVKAKVQNTGAAPMLPGLVNLFMGGDFIGRSYQPLVGPEGFFDVFLGRDDAVKITRKEMIRKEDVSGVLRKTRNLRLGYTIEVENFHPKAVEITLEDQLPVSANSEIHVSTHHINPKPEEQDKKTGKITWKLKVEGKQKKTIEVVYDVTSPAEKPVPGL